MAFPKDPLGVNVELFIAGAWVNLTAAGLMYERDPVTVSRGRADEATDVERSTCLSTGKNTSGNLSPRNPTGIYYGAIGRNTPLRVRLATGSPGYLLKPVELDGAETPDSANLSITGDIDIRVDVKADDWDLFGGLANKFSGASQRSWTFWKNADGTLALGWSTDGANLLTRTSTAAVSVPTSGRLGLRVTLDVDNGAAGHDVKFYIAPDINGSWTQLGSTVTTAGVTSIFDSTAAVQIGRSNFGIGLVGRLYAFKLFQGIDGTLRADVNLNDEEPGPGPFTDGQGLVWTLIADASIVRPDIRFNGEVSEWPQQWDSSQDVTVPLEASGVLRRLTQGVSALKSTLYRAMTSAPFNILAYWPCEDGADATEIASGIGGPPMTLIGTPDFEANDEFKCSVPLPLLSQSQWTGVLPSYTVTGSTQVWLLLKVPTAGGIDNEGIFRMHMAGGTIKFVDLIYHTAGGDLEMRITDNDDIVVANTTIDFNIDGKLIRVSVDLKQVGGNFDWAVNAREQGTSFVAGNGATVNTQTLGRATALVINPGADLNDIVVGHVSVHDSIRSLFEMASQLDAFAGETAGRRIQRLCQEEDVAFRAVGNLDATSKTGPQLPAELVTLLREAAAADGGILHEPRDLFGLAYRTREGMYRQAAALALDYTGSHLADLDPTDDDQHVRNDITVRRTGGSSHRAVKSSGALSILPPPAGVGRYDEEVNLNVAADSQLPDQAGWRLLLGTLDEARFPTVEINLAHRVFTTNQPLTLAVQDLDIGGRVTIANPPAWLPPEIISQLAQGFAERMGAVVHAININCAPETPWSQVATYDGTARYSSDGSTLASGITSSATSLSVATPTGPLWTHADSDFDIRIGGEVMRVTAVSGASSPQTFTVTRSINTVVKAHSSGAVVELAQLAVYAI